MTFSELEPPELRWDLLLAAVGLTKVDKADWDEKTDAARVFLTARLAVSPLAPCTGRTRC